MTNTLISAERISKTFPGVRALDNFSISIEKGSIHSLCGENGSGKSTLIKVFAGVHQPDKGSIIKFEGEDFQHNKSIDAIRKGIQIIYQDLSLFNNLTVAENISINQTIENKVKIINWKKIRLIAEESMNKIAVKLNPKLLIGNLSIANKMLVAICRAITDNVKLLIMDEPTSALTKDEVEVLFSVLRNLKDHGISILFVSHKLEEVLEIADVVTVVRDGKTVGTYDTDDLTINKLITYMIGREISNSIKSSKINPVADRKKLFEVKKLSKKGNFKDISFELLKGDILGIVGPLGAGRTELASSIFGIEPYDSGEIYIKGKIVKIKSNQIAIKSGINLVPEDRLKHGLIFDQTIGSNIIISVYDRLLNKIKLISETKKNNITSRQIKDFDIKCNSADELIQSLSGGNQQRAVLAKCLATDPEILILDNPTVGVDVGAKFRIYEIIKKLADRGMGIILISDEIPEIMINCNKVIVMKKGKIIKDFGYSKVAEEDIKICLG